MNYRNARLANGFLSLDKLAGEIDLVKSRVVSDGGAGAERMIGDLDRRPGDAAREAEAREAETARRRKIHAAITRLYRAGRGYLVPVLRLIVKNGSARHLSLEKISRASYFRHRDELLRFFS